MLDKLIKDLLDGGFAEKRSRGWHSPVAETYDCIHTASQRLPSVKVIHEQDKLTMPRKSSPPLGHFMRLIKTLNHSE